MFIKSESKNINVWLDYEIPKKVDWKYIVKYYNNNCACMCASWITPYQEKVLIPKL